MEDSKAKKVINKKTTVSKGTASKKKSTTTVKKASATPRKKTSTSAKTSTTKVEKVASPRKKAVKEEVIISEPEVKKESNVIIDKRILIPIIAAMVALLFLLIGATYAYFSVTGSMTQTQSNISSSTEAPGTVTIINPTGNLHIRLSAVSMGEANAGTPYYATSVQDAEYDVTAIPRPVARATVSGGSVSTNYTCSFSFNVTTSGTMKDELQTGDAKLILSGAYSGEFDLASIFSSRTITFNSLSGSNTEQVMYAVVRFNNKASSQDYLEGTSLTITLTNSDFACEIS